MCLSRTISDTFLVASDQYAGETHLAMAHEWKLCPESLSRSGQGDRPYAISGGMQLESECLLMHLIELKVVRNTIPPDLVGLFVADRLIIQTFGPLSSDEQDRNRWATSTEIFTGRSFA